MAEVSAGSQLTLLEDAKRHNNGQVVAVAEVLAEINPVLQSAPFVEANDGRSHIITKRTGLPSGSFREINQGTATEASQTKQVVETCGILEAYSEIDVELVQGSANPSAYRATEDAAFLEGLAQTFSSEFYYGNPALDSQGFKGLAPRVSSLSSVDERGVKNVIGSSGTGSDLSSLWIVWWGLNTCHLIRPRGKSVALSVEDLGRERKTDSNGRVLDVFRTKFQVPAGLAVHQDSAIQRIANIETAGASNTLDDDDILTALNNGPRFGQPVIYCNRTIKTQLEILAKDQSNINYTPGQFGGVETMFYRGVPVRIDDGITNTESALS